MWTPAETDDPTRNYKLDQFYSSQGKPIIASPRQRYLPPSPIPAQWFDAQYREAYMETAIEQGVAWQIRVNREERGWTQKQLAALMDTRQSAVSRLEDPEAGNLRLSTLVKVANAFGCALIVRFAPYSEFAVLSSDLRPERLFAASFNAENGTQAISHGN